MNDYLKHPSIGIKALRKMIPKVYMWLYRHDYEWLSEHKPMPNTKKKNIRHVRIDWKKRDSIVSKLIEKQGYAFAQSETKPMRITISMIGRKIGHAALLQQHMDKMPKSSATISKFIENQDEFHVRKLRWAYDALRQESAEPKQWQVLRRANIWRHRFNPKVIEVLSSLGLRASTTSGR